jgi:phage-related protein
VTRWIVSAGFPLKLGRILAINWSWSRAAKTPTDFRPMPDVGPGAMEIRVHAGSEYRVFYVARFEEAVYVLHCFQKKTQKTRDADIELGRRRYRAAMGGRKT